MRLSGTAPARPVTWFAIDLPNAPTGITAPWTGDASLALLSAKLTTPAAVQTSLWEGVPPRAVTYWACGFSGALRGAGTAATAAAVPSTAAICLAVTSATLTRSSSHAPLLAIHYSQALSRLGHAQFDRQRNTKVAVHFILAHAYSLSLPCTSAARPEPPIHARRSASACDSSSSAPPASPKPGD
jgi:hypothetical protein